MIQTQHDKRDGAPSRHTMWRYVSGAAAAAAAAAVAAVAAVAAAGHSVAELRCLIGAPSVTPWRLGIPGSGRTRWAAGESVPSLRGRCRRRRGCWLLAAGWVVETWR
jgi:hypothetical protein